MTLQLYLQHDEICILFIRVSASQGECDWQAHWERRLSDAVCDRAGQSDPRQKDAAHQGESSALANPFLRSSVGGAVNQDSRQLLLNWLSLAHYRCSCASWLGNKKLLYGNVKVLFMLLVSGNQVGWRSVQITLWRFCLLSLANNTKTSSVFYNCAEFSFPTDYSVSGCVIYCTWSCLVRIITTILFLFSGSGASEQV